MQLMKNPQCQYCDHVRIQRPVRKIRYQCNNPDSEKFKQFVNGRYDHCDKIKPK